MRTRKGVNTEVEAGERKTRIASVIETLLWVAAALCLFPLIATSVARPVVSQLATQHAPPAPEVQDLGPAETADTAPQLVSDTADWSPQRLGALERLRASLAPDTQGTLLLPR
ncbi:MAG: hypothetical protein HKN58_04535, partial [Xanthomonadales bacterium]|nr:hypothetical protein [Xanthomonadales bacterium]